MNELEQNWLLALTQYRTAETEWQLNDAIANIKGLMLLSREMEETSNV